jgi:hypothetical protein
MYARIAVGCGLLTAWLATALVGQADPPKFERRDNHVSPLMVKLTFLDKKVKPAKVMVYGVLDWSLYSRLCYDLTGDGDTSVSVWLDTIREIKEIDDKRLTIVFKDGKERQFRHKQEKLMVYHPNDSTERVPLVKLKQVRFLQAPRMDKEKQAMFDHWRYSPFTGEKLPPVEEK